MNRQASSRLLRFEAALRGQTCNRLQRFAFRWTMEPLREKRSSAGALKDTNLDKSRYCFSLKTSFRRTDLIMRILEPMSSKWTLIQFNLIGKNNLPTLKAMVTDRNVQ